MPSMWLVSTAPGGMNRFGSRALPTPDGVPVKMMSPGSSGQTADSWEISSRHAEHQVTGPPELQHLVAQPAAELQVVRVAEFIHGDQRWPEGGEAG